ncbi:MAG: hypothetical protein OXI77_18355 [Chloroflexota bacterium]|nr:hypothetical protein [Chloroflexota bacterium]MDE2909027.1 hypothetical protein [Chloroflexota bacterium]
MPNMGMIELAIVVQILLILLFVVVVPYLIIRQAVLSALRKFYRELDGAGKKKIQAQANS